MPPLAGDTLHHIEVIVLFHVFLQMLEDCLQNSSLAGFLENHHSSHDCEAHQLKMLLHQPVTRVSIPIRLTMVSIPIGCS